VLVQDDFVDHRKSDQDLALPDELDAEKGQRMNDDEVWSAIDAQRVRTADLTFGQS